MRRVACLYLPRFVAWVHLRAKGADPATPLAVVDGRVVATNEAAARCGVRAGMSAVQACATRSDLLLVPYDVERMRTAMLSVAEGLLTLSPTVEPHAGWFFLDAGCGEIRLAHEALRIASGLGFPARVAIADERFTAAALARASAEPVVVVPPGESRRALAPLSVELLPLPEPMARGLELLGIRSLGELARLREADVAARWGGRGVTAHRLARGLDPTPLRGFAPPLRLVETASFEQPVASFERLGPAIERLASTLALRLRRHGQAASRLEVTLHLDHAASHAVTLTPIRPIASARPLCALVEGSLHDVSLPAPVAAITIEARQTVPHRPSGLPLFGRRPCRDGHELETCLSRLRGLLGDEAVHGVRLAETYRPEAMTERIPFHEAMREPPTPRASEVAVGRTLDAPQTSGCCHTASAPAEGRHAAQALRMFDPPIPVEILGDAAPRLRWLGASRRILQAAGPLRLWGEWWRAPFARDYFELTLDDGTRCWIFRDEAERFFAQGLMD